jgi:hypothetical protein
MYDLELYSECVWVEILTVAGITMLIGNHYFSLDTKLEVITIFAFLKTFWTLTIFMLFY